jgi:signal transduction histidine kinase
MAKGPTTKFERARLDIARQHLDAAAPLPRALARAMFVSAMTLEVSRVGLWRFSADRRTIQVDPMFERERGVWSAGTTLDLTRYPAYAEALGSRRMVRADDARSDPRTRELLADYLAPAGIVAMLDAPVFRGGEVVAVVCHEHTGPLRRWSDRDVDFAVSVADMLGALFEQAERLETEARAARGARLEALGRLAGACAHDVGNVLSAIGLTAQELLLHPRPTPEECHAAARTIVDQCQRGGALSRQLLAFARGEPGAPEVVVDLGEVVRGTTAVLEPLAKERATLTVEVEPGPHLVRAVRSELEQVVLNLVVNGRDAIPPGRVGHVAVRIFADGLGGTLLEVSDDGVGMDAATRERALEPFFTTKPEGSGMGLSIVHGAVTRAGGTLTLESAPGVGTTVTVSLPRAA